MRIVTYADDCGPVLQGNTRTALQRLREIMGTVKLTVNEERCADACRRQETELGCSKSVGPIANGWKPIIASGGLMHLAPGRLAQLVPAPIGNHMFRATGSRPISAMEPRARADDGRARKPAHDQALRPDEATAYARRG